jgi:hypothetical protein
VSERLPTFLELAETKLKYAGPRDKTIVIKVTINTARMMVESERMSALRPYKNTESFKDTLSEVRDLIEGYVDVKDGDYGVPMANNAMRAVQLIDGAL